MKTKYAKEGMYLMNGDTIVKSVNLPDDADPSVWVEITAEEADKRMNGEEATEEDYQSALREMGVKV